MNKTASNEEVLIGEGVGFERIRRITGYLVGDMNRFNNAKRAEVEDRVKHAGESDSDEHERAERQRPTYDQTLLTRLWVIEQGFNLPITYQMTYKKDDVIYADLEYSLSDLETRLAILEGVAKNQERMTTEQVEFWLDAVRYDGEIDLDKTPNQEKNPERINEGIRERMERAQALSGQQNTEHQEKSQNHEMVR